MDSVMRYITELCIQPVWCSMHAPCLDKKIIIFPSIKKETVRVKRQVIMTYRTKKVKST